MGRVRILEIYPFEKETDKLKATHWQWSLSPSSCKDIVQASFVFWKTLF